MKTRFMMFFAFVLAIASFSLAVNHQPETSRAASYHTFGTSIVGGYISEDTTWTMAGSPYIVAQTVIVEPGVALSIEPGVDVRFANGTELVIDGSLNAKGNATNFVTFTSNATTPKPGDWGAIKFRQTSNDTSCVINWAIIKYASFGIDAYGSSPKIQNSRIQHNANFGIFASSLFLFEDRGTPLIQNCTISDNGGQPLGGSGRQGGIYIDFGSIDIRDSLIENNTGYGIVGVGSSGAVAVRSIVRNNTGTGVEGDVAISNSEITGNGQSGVLKSGEFHYNRIFGNTPFDYKNPGGSDVNATYNWWGTTNETLINEHIYDYYDDYTLGRVTYKPCLFSPYFVYIDGQVYNVAILSNSSATDFNFIQSAKSISFSVSGTDGTVGFCNVTMPKELLWGTIIVYKDESPLQPEVDYTQEYNGTHYLLWITYSHSTHTIRITGTEVIPEFSFALVLPIYIVGTLLVVIILRKNRRHSL